MNENKLAVFTNPDFGEVRTLEINGEPWFVGRDICAVFGDTNSSRSLGRIDDDDKQTAEITDNKGRKQNAIFVNESGLYALLFAMQPQKAHHDGVSDEYPIEIQERIDKLHKFKRWVTSEVLPSIRKTGAYTVNTNAEQWSRQLDVEEKKADAMLLEAKAKQAAILLEFTRLNLSPEANQALVACASELMTGVKALPLPEVEKTYSAGEVGEMFGVSGNRIGRVANAKGLKTEKYGIFVLDKARGHNKQVQTFRYNQAAVDFFRGYFEEG
jgi:prophage antirepressor-like protein